MSAALLWNWDLCLGLTSPEMWIQLSRSWDKCLDYINLQLFTSILLVRRCIGKAKLLLLCYPHSADVALQCFQSHLSSYLYSVMRELWKALTEKVHFWCAGTLFGISRSYSSVRVIMLRSRSEEQKRPVCLPCSSCKFFMHWLVTFIFDRQVRLWNV